MTHTTMKTFASLLFVSFGLSFSSISSGFAQEMITPEIKAPPALTPVRPVWEPWDLKTLGVQLTAVPLSLGVAASNFYFGTVVGILYFDRFPLADDDPNDGDYDEFFEISSVLAFGVGSGILGYTLSQGLLIGAIGDAMGGDGGMGAPVAAGFVNMMLWGGVIYLTDGNVGHYQWFMATTLLSQLAAYHLSASFHQGGFVEREPSALSNFSLGLAPTDGGASLGLGFQF